VGLAVFAVATVGLAPLLHTMVPQSLLGHFDAGSVEQILGILASSMLAVTTFSLSIAVSAFAAAASSATPRATALLQEDPTTQNVLATFLGAFLFSLVGLIAIRTELYDDAAQWFLFIATLFVVALVVVALLRWISHLMSFGRMNDTLDRVERAALQSLEQRLENPYLCGSPLGGDMPPAATPLLSVSTGYVQHVDMSALSQLAEELGTRLFLIALPGKFVHPQAELLRTDAELADESQRQALRGAFTIGTERSFDQDPRFGLIVLAEIASRALSPAVNDPGTAISVIGRLVRVLGHWRERVEPPRDFPEVFVPGLRSTDMLEDAFRPIARDGAGIFEVQMRLRKALDSLSRAAPAPFADAADDLAARALHNAREAGLDDRDLQALSAIPVGAPRAPV
jgi:uncharacterized membrane protein